MSSLLGAPGNVYRNTPVHWINPTSNSGRVVQLLLADDWLLSMGGFDRKVSVFNPNADPEDASHYSIRASELFLTADKAKKARMKKLKQQGQQELRDMVKTLTKAGYRVIGPKGREL